MRITRLWITSSRRGTVSTTVGSTSVTTNTNGGTAQSPDFVVPGTGFYCFRAEYTPDASSGYSAALGYNATQQSANNGGECFSVTK